MTKEKNNNTKTCICMTIPAIFFAGQHSFFGMCCFSSWEKHARTHAYVSLSVNLLKGSYYALLQSLDIVLGSTKTCSHSWCLKKIHRFSQGVARYMNSYGTVTARTSWFGAWGLTTNTGNSPPIQKGAPAVIQHCLITASRRTVNAVSCALENKAH